MGLFDVLGSIGKAAVTIISLPVKAVADVITVGGAVTNRDEPYTSQAVNDLANQLQQVGAPDDN